MRKLALVLAVVMLMTALAVPALAVQSRAITILPEITVNGTSVQCNVRCVGNTMSEKLEATIKLYRGNDCIETWEREANGYIFFSETVNVSASGTYTLTVDLTVNGNPCPTASASDS